MINLTKGETPEAIKKLQEKESKAADLKKLQRTDPVKKQEEHGLEKMENTPMEPPSAYDQPGPIKASSENMEKSLQMFMEDHQMVLKQIDAFEKALVQFKTNGYKLDSKINEVFGSFYKHFDNELLPHNDKEEKVLFPILHKRLIEVGEHSTGPNPTTAIDVMEDDHVKFIQLGTLSFNLMGLATRIKDETSRMFILDTAYQSTRELVELLKLHIYREDFTLFPLAQKFLSKEELAEIEKEMHKF